MPYLLQLRISLTAKHNPRFHCDNTQRRLGASPHTPVKCTQIGASLGCKVLLITSLHLLRPYNCTQEAFKPTLLEVCRYCRGVASPASQSASLSHPTSASPLQPTLRSLCALTLTHPIPLLPPLSTALRVSSSGVPTSPAH